ncbi:MAG: MGMT family protein [Nanoarchaeota archaeon]|nr:MGMT family protein [Nanoarchaeota archaeon]
MKFSDKVYKVCKNIPKGKITTYKIVASRLNSKAYRAVGNALNKNPYKTVPCHRVINSQGHLHGFATGLKNKEKLLKKEGIKIKNNKVLNFKKHLYKF